MDPETSSGIRVESMEFGVQSYTRLEETQQRTYSRLSKMAIDILSAQGMSAESERVFSLARRTIS